MTLELFFSILIIAILVIGGVFVLISRQKQKAIIADLKQTLISEYESQSKKIVSMQRDMKKIAKTLAEINQKISVENSQAN